MRQPGLAVSFLYFDDYRCFLRVVSLGIVGLVAEVVTAFFIFPRGIDKAAVIRHINFFILFSFPIIRSSRRSARRSRRPKILFSLWFYS